MNPKLSPAGYISDGCFKVPGCVAEQYISTIIEICNQNNISIIIPTIDTELKVYAQHKSELVSQGIHVIVSNIDFIRTCRDKRLTSEFFTQKGISIPRAIDLNHPTFPIFAKPYDGSLSTNLHLIKTAQEITDEIKNDPKLIFMEYINPADFKEFTVDMYYGRDNHVKAIVPRERIKVRAGEINKGITRKNYIIEFLKQRLTYIEGVTGCICIQLFYRESDNEIYGIEINPRFGGGYPLSYYAGANFADYILKEYLLNDSVEYTDNWRDNTLMLRYDKEVIIYE